MLCRRVRTRDKVVRTQNPVYTNSSLQLTPYSRRLLCGHLEEMACRIIGGVKESMGIFKGNC
jgi:hypothetical protein